MLTREELIKRIERDEELYTRLTNERKTIYQRLRRYRNLLHHMNEMELTLNNEVCDD